MNSPGFYSPNTPNAPAPAQDEKLMAALAHASILVPHAGLIVPLVLWLVHSNQPGRSPFAAFQSKQDFFFQLWTVVLEWLAIAACFVLGFFSLGLAWFLILPIVGLGHLAAVIFGIIGAVDSFHGRDFRYPVLGPMLQP